MSLVPADEQHSEFPPSKYSTRELKNLGERELWASALAVWLKWPHLGYDGEIRTSLIKM